MTFSIAFPSIDPVLVEIGPFAIRWYALAYIAGLVLGWRYMRWMARRPPHAASDRDIDDFLVWATLAVVVGGRLGYVLFYKPGTFATDPLAALEIWRGGMSFHGGLIGVALMAWVFCVRRGLPKLRFGDMVACAAPIGLFFGRVANFVNAELVGRVSDVPWAMVFPGHGPVPRHPSQLYEAALEGLLLFVFLHLLWRRDELRRRAGTLTGCFLAGYAVARWIGELFRQPDAHIGFLFAGTTMGQLLSLPMFVIGIVLIARAGHRSR